MKQSCVYMNKERRIRREPVLD